MAVKINLDRRTRKVDGTCPIVMSLTHKGTTIRVSTRMYAAPEEWNTDASSYIGGSTSVKAGNAKLRYMQSQADMLLLNLEMSGELDRMTVAELKGRLAAELGLSSTPVAGKTLCDFLERAKDGRSENAQLRYEYTKRKVKEFDATRRVTDIDDRWVVRFRDFLAERYAPNTVNQDLMRVGSAMNLAISQGVITRNPTLRVKRPRPKVKKKALALQQLRLLRDMELSSKRQQRARDLFMLQFYLLGINLADLYDLRGMDGGRVEYVRRKTGTQYSVRVEPEALEIIERIAGVGRLVDIPYKSVRAAVSSIDGCLARMGIAPGLSTNWARHTWATMAAELEIPMETVSHALGHQIGSPVTAIYITFNQRKIDEANRRVIDYVNADLKGKK